MTRVVGASPEFIAIIEVVTPAAVATTTEVVVLRKQVQTKDQPVLAHINSYSINSSNISHSSNTQISNNNRSNCN